MKKLLLIMLASLFMLTSCDLFLEEDEIEYSTLTDKTAAYIYTVLDDVQNSESDNESPTDKAFEEVYTAFYKAEAYYKDENKTTSISGPDSEDTDYKYNLSYDGENNYQYDITVSEKLSSSSFSGTHTIYLKVKVNIVETEVPDGDNTFNGSYSQMSRETANLELTGYDIKSFKADYTMLEVSSYTDETVNEEDNEENTITTISGTITVDGVNYRASDFFEYSDSLDDEDE